MLVFLSACGHKKAQVRAPNPSLPSSPSTISSSDLEGLASYYAEPYHGRKTASGEIFDTYQGMTAAHRTLPFNTMVRVTNKTNGREVDVRINDRGPFIDGRVIDLSLRAAREIDLVGPGVAPVKLKILKEGEVAKVARVEKVAVSETPTPAPPPPAFAVQVGAFENEHKAEELRKQLEKKYPTVAIQTVSTDKTLYRVRIGEPDMETANKIVSELRKHDLKPFVVRVSSED
jgi:peptidoglycan lytic transglycosylase